jgi:hypothetical protein
MIFQDVPHWWGVLLIVLVWWFLQNIIHEGAHAIVYKLLGYEITKFAPWPNKWTPPGEDKPKWAFARMWCEWPEDKDPVDKPSQKLRGWATSAPVFVNTILLIILIPITSLIDGVAHAILAGWIITNFADGTNNWRAIFIKDTGKHRSDMWRTIYKWELSLPLTRIVAISWFLLFACLLLIPTPW